MEKEREILHTIDDYLLQCAKYVSLYKILTPNNIETELALFLEKNGEYDPLFSYNFPKQEDLDRINKELETIQETYFKTNKFTLPIAHIIEEKVIEIQNKIKIINAYRNQDFTAIEKYNTLLFGPFDTAIAKKAEEITRTYKDPDPTIRGKKLNNEEIISYINDYKEKHNLSDLEIRILGVSINKFVMACGKTTSYIVFSKHLQLREKELASYLLHEIEVHYRRHKNAENSEWNIIKHGTAGYEKDEEGLALYNMYTYQKSIYPSFEKESMYKKYLLLMNSQGKSFKEITKDILSSGYSKSIKRAFLIATNIKKGITDTSKTIPGNIFIQNKVYAEGREKVKKRIDEGNDITPLLQGKIKIEDIPYIRS